MRKLLSTVLVTSFCFLVSAVFAEEAMFKISSKSVNFSDIDMVAQEVNRDGRISRIEFIDNDTNQGSILSKDFFRLRSLSTYANQRGYRYFIVLDTEGIKAQVVGLLKSKNESLGEVLGEYNKDLPTDSIIDIEYVKPFAVELTPKKLSQ